MSRIETREAAVVFIYQSGFREKTENEDVNFFLENNPSVTDDEEYFLKVVHGVLDNREEIDALITPFLKNWTLNRLPKLDRAILEVAVYEIKHLVDIPTSVAINEAVKLAKKYGTDESKAYINGLLSAFEKSL